MIVEHFKPNKNGGYIFEFENKICNIDTVVCLHSPYKDINDKYIKVSDIVKFKSIFHNYTDIGVVMFNEDGFYIKGKRDRDVHLNISNVDFIEIIGNIFENVDLLRGV